MHWGERAFGQQKIRHKKRAKTAIRSQSLVAFVAGAKKGGGGGGGEEREPLPLLTGASTLAMQTVERRTKRARH